MEFFLFCVLINKATIRRNIIIRRKPHQLQWLETMSQRTKLDTSQLSELQKLQRGFTGEQDMDRLIETILGKNVDCLEDLILEYQNSVVQIDKLLVLGSTLYLIDMKFYRVFILMVLIVVTLNDL